MRSELLHLWSKYHLILPESSKYVNGSFEYTARNIMGTRTPFERINISVAEPMQDGCLHLVSYDTSRSIELMPFVQVVPSPKTELDACYFYSRIDSKSGDARYISYHYEGDSEQIIPNESLMLAIEKINKE